MPPCKLLQPLGTFEQKKTKKKKSKKNKASTKANAEKPQTLTPQDPPQSPQPQIHITTTLSLSSKKSKTKSLHQQSQSTDPRGSSSCSVTELCELQAPDSLRWEGALEDPKAEAERLEQYRANRRRRYIVHREREIRDGGDALTKTMTTKGTSFQLN